MPEQYPSSVPNVSPARGMAVFKLSDDRMSLHYSLTVANLHDTLQAHIHVAPPGVNGPVVAFLYPSGPPPVLIPGRFSGNLMSGTITAEDLRGPLAGMSLDALLAAIRDGNAYVNAHTVQFPGGEIRGQIAAHGR
jgi:hypothetical protein